ncbi:hypothetical protein BC834DRAFT_884304 [Gloeopeniophorella convolvens]|nr:hypothetical protein BC834DRAFT_884304 [Gloeopeniophorella convolvens]
MVSNSAGATHATDGEYVVSPSKFAVRAHVKYVSGLRVPINIYTHLLHVCSPFGLSDTMRDFFRLALSFLTLNYAQLPFDLTSTPSVPAIPSKRIAIVGGGTGGVAMLKTLAADLPEDATRNWDIVLFEQRYGLGGVWLPDPQVPHPPDLPETPLYPRLRTNTPHPTMTIPGFPYPPGTPLFPRHTFVRQYHDSVVSHFNLSSYIRLNHEVLSTVWHGNNATGHWQVTVLDRTHNQTIQADFDHLIVASGHNHYPNEPSLQGRQAWETSSPGREVIHSIFYREPEAFRGRNVVVVGGGASGRDIAQQVVDYANSTYVAVKEDRLSPIPYPVIPGTERFAALSHFTPHEVVFADGRSLSHIDTVVLATGYELSIPFLSSSIRSTSVVDALPDCGSLETLTNNGRYLRPLFRHVFSLAQNHPPLALSFVGLPIFVANSISDVAQALLIGHALANDTLLPSRQTQLADLRAQEAALDDPGRVGHRIVQPGGREGYQDALVAYLQAHGLGGQYGVPPSGTAFTEWWRVLGGNEGLRLRRAWLRVEELGEADQWLDSVKNGTEAEWADFMVRLVQWEKAHEEEAGLELEDEGYAFEW